MSLATLAEVKSWIGSVKESSHDALLTGLEQRVSSYAEGVTRRTLLFDDDVQQLIRGRGERFFWLRSPPIAGTLVIEERTSLTSAWSVVAASKYEINTTDPDTSPRRRRVFRTSGGVWADLEYDHFETVRATYDAGYTDETVPGDLKQAILDIISVSYRNRPTVTAVVPVSSDARDIPIRVPTTAKQTLELYTTPEVEAWGDVSSAIAGAGIVRFERA